MRPPGFSTVDVATINGAQEEVSAENVAPCAAQSSIARRRTSPVNR
jgi:hypothetical protein